MSHKCDRMDIEGYINATGEERIKVWLEPGDAGAITHVINPRPFRLRFLEHIRYHSSSGTPLPRASFLYTVRRTDCNEVDNLSGGGAASPIDFLSILPICYPRDPSWLYLGISRTLTLSFLRPMRLGQTVRIEGEVLAIGKMFATIRAVIKSENDGKLMMTAEHGIVKFNTPKL